jgi:hypothetical protein
MSAADGDYYYNPFLTILIFEKEGIKVPAF